MNLPFEIWNIIFDQISSFKVKKNLYDALPDNFRIQYPKFTVPDGDKFLLEHLLVDDEKEVILSLKIGGYYGLNSNPIFIKSKCKEFITIQTCSQNIE